MSKGIGIFLKKFGSCKRKEFICFTLIVLIFFTATKAYCDEEEYSGTLTAITGSVKIYKYGEKNGVPAESNIPVEEGDKLKTGSKSKAEILLDDGSIIMMEELSEITIESFRVDPKQEKVEVSLLLRIGQLFAGITKFKHRNSRVDIRTPTAVAGVRGTEFVVEVLEDQENGDHSLVTDVGVFEGNVMVDGLDKNGNILKGVQEPLVPGTQSRIKRFKAPERKRAFSKRMLIHKKKMVLFRKNAVLKRMKIQETIKKRRAAQLKFKKRWKLKKPVKKPLQKPIPPKKPIKLRKKPKPLFVPKKK